LSPAYSKRASPLIHHLPELGYLLFHPFHILPLFLQIGRPRIHIYIGTCIGIPGGPVEGLPDLLFQRPAERFDVRFAEGEEFYAVVDRFLSRGGRLCLCLCSCLGR
jgi:hypothetical protein